jgi:hypothetical protein
VIDGAGRARDLEVVDRRAGGSEQSQRLGLGIIPVGWRGAAGAPVAALRAGDDDAEGQRLGVGQIAAADFEEARAFGAARLVAAGGGDQAGEERGTHRLHVLADRVGQDPGAAAERLGFGLADEAPRHRFVEAAGGCGAAGAALQQLLGRGGGEGDAGSARERGRLDPIEPFDADHFLDDVRLALDVAAPGGGGHLPRSRRGRR